MAAIEECVDKNPSKVERILTGSFKQLKMARLKLDAKLNESLKTLLLKYPKIFSTPSCIEVSKHMYMYNNIPQFYMRVYGFKLC